MKENLQIIMQNRSIKFRAWKKSENKMYERVLVNPDGWVHTADFSHDIEKNDITLEGLGDDGVDCFAMQFTGLKGKNGVEIFEGDVVKEPIDFVSSTLGIIKWDNESAMFIFEQDGHKYDFNHVSAPLEVIGNIYQNPELLSAK